MGSKVREERESKRDMSNMGYNVNRKMRVDVGVAKGSFLRRCWCEMVKEIRR